jgi:hypothetical protein
MLRMKKSVVCYGRIKSNMKVEPLDHIHSCQDLKNKDIVLRKCLLKSCNNLTYNDTGYCCEDHRKQNIKKDRYN